ncbi:DUF4268 domain-containing protein [Nocardioides sp.]|uniref:DUF4268 domain-containing protein n=1 Tax=Nocardioides sp. TaxID=35761 RepID=UPI0039E3F04C
MLGHEHRCPRSRRGSGCPQACPASTGSSFSQSGLSVQLVFEKSDRDLNVARLEALATRKAEVEAAFGAPLAWETREGLKSSKVAAYTDVADVAQEERWDGWIEWLITTGERMRTALAAGGGIPLPAGLSRDQSCGTSVGLPGVVVGRALGDGWRQLT